MQQFHPALLLLLCVGCVSASASQRRGAGDLEWKACETVGNTTTELICSALKVPKDYNSSDETNTIELKLAKSAATKEPFRGSILFNSGGPGYAGRNDLDLLHGDMQSVLGGHHDIVTWDPRGTGQTLPLSCFQTETERATYWSQIPDQATNASDTAAGEAWATAQWLAAVCGNSTQANTVGELVGTTYTARDVMQILNALGEDGLLRYWGISYGSALGEAVALMYPDRMDKVLLDANLNPGEWWAGGSVSQISDADAEFQSFLQQCFEAPDICPLAAQASTVEDLSTQLYDLFNDIKYEPLVFGPYGMVTYAHMKSIMLGMLYARNQFDTMALFLNSLLTQNTTQYVEWLVTNTASSSAKKPFPDFSGAATKENTWGIRCSDEGRRSENLSEMLPLLSDYHHESEAIGDISWSTGALVCAQWPFHAKERLRPDQFHDIKTKSPIMFVQNKFDPVTSVHAARNASAAFYGSKLLINEGHGHGFMSEPTLCGIKAVRAYFNDGILPEEDETFCTSKAPPFVVQDLSEVLASGDA